jgi:hypothetical protein
MKSETTLWLTVVYGPTGGTEPPILRKKAIMVVDGLIENTQKFFAKYLKTAE